MANLPTVSIVTPSFNHGRYLEATIRSVLDQKYPDLQYLVLDGGSTDETPEILQKYAGQLDYTIAPDRGQADAIAIGFSRCTGQIITWLNSDDCLKPGSILAAAQYLRDHPDIALVYGDAEFIRADGSRICDCANPEPFSRRRLRYYSDYIVQPAAFFRRSAYESVGGLDRSLHYAMDYDLWLKLADRYDFAYVRECWAQYRWLGENKSATGSWRRIDEVRAVAVRHGVPHLPAYFQLELVNLHLQSAKESLNSGHAIQSLKAMAQATLSALQSPEALWSLTDPHTRKLIQIGKILRQSAIANCKSQIANSLTPRV